MVHFSPFLFWFSDEFKNFNNDPQDSDENPTLTSEMSKPTFHMDQSALAKPLLSDVTFAHDEMGVDNPLRTSGVTAVSKVSVCSWTATSHSTSLWVACMRISLCQ